MAIDNLMIVNIVLNFIASGEDSERLFAFIVESWEIFIPSSFCMLFDVCVVLLLFFSSVVPDQLTSLRVA